LNSLKLFFLDNIFEESELFGRIYFIYIVHKHIINTLHFIIWKEMMACTKNSTEESNRAEEFRAKIPTNAWWVSGWCGRQNMHNKSIRVGCMSYSKIVGFAWPFLVLLDLSQRDFFDNTSDVIFEVLVCL